MNEAFDPYHEWLGLTPGLTTPDYYQLCGLDSFATDVAAIRTAVDRAIAKVRSFRPGAHAAQWTRLLDELATAKSTLLDPQKKAAYDQALRAKRDSAPPSAPKSNPELAAVNRDPNLYPPGMEPAAPRPPKTSSTTPPRKPAATGKKRAAVKKRPGAEAGGRGKIRQPGADAKTRDVASPKSRASDKGPRAGEKPRPKTAAPQPNESATAASRQTQPAQKIQESHDAPAEIQPINAHVAPPPQAHASLWPVILGVAAVIVLLTLGIFYLAVYAAG